MSWKASPGLTGGTNFTECAEALGVASGGPRRVAGEGWRAAWGLVGEVAAPAQGAPEPGGSVSREEASEPKARAS